MLKLFQAENAYSRPEGQSLLGGDILLATGNAHPLLIPIASCSNFLLEAQIAIN